MVCCVFFFQAEDGIRDLVRSRGLGDVYKRQVTDMLSGNAFGAAGCRVVIEEFLEGEEASFIVMVDGSNVPVSYTHLTLPTSDLV